MNLAKKPWWQQATALVTVTTGGVITGFNFVPGAAATMTTPTSVPLHLLALEQAGQPGGAMNARAIGGDSADAATGNALLRSAIVNVAKYYLQLAATRTPAQMEALIWDNTSVNGADHGPWCAAFASLTLELAAQAVGQQSWVTGGTSYPWALPAWADVRIDENPASPDITSMVQDAQAHDRWRPVGDGYQPQPGDWVLFDQHVEVVTSYSGGVLDSIGADSAPNLSVNAHSVSGPLAAAGVQGFIDNGNLARAATATQPAPAAPTAPVRVSAAPAGRSASTAPATAGGGGQAVVPGVAKPVLAPTAGAAVATTEPGRTAGFAAGFAAAVPGDAPAVGDVAHAGVIPGASPAANHQAAQAPAATPSTPAASSTPTPSSSPAHASTAPPTASATPPASATPSPSASTPAAKSGQYRRYAAPAQSTPGTRAQQAFISLVAPGAEAAQQRWGVPAAVTIAQAIDESAWGNSGLAADYHNLFGIKGDGPAGSVDLPTSEFYNGQWVNIDAPFRVYHNVAESIADHAELIATSGYYTRAMADRAFPDAFANDLTGVYATDPEYGSTIISIMKLYNLYRFDVPTASAPSSAPAPSPHAPAPSPHAPASQPTAPPASQPTAPPASTGHAHPSPTAAGHQAGASAAQIPGLATPALAPTSAPATHAAGTTRPASRRAGAAPGTTNIPGLSGAADAAAATEARLSASRSPATGARLSASRSPAPRSAAPRSPAAHVVAATLTADVQPMPAASAAARRPTAAANLGTAPRYQPELPHAMTAAFFADARGPLAHGEHLYRDVAAQADISWKLLAACDWMQCKAHPRYSPVHGEKLGTVNSDGTSYRTKSAALAQCANDLIDLAGAVYGIDLTARRPLSVRALADVFAAFRWGALLRKHRVSAMEFPYAVAGLTAQHLKMHWPLIDDPAAPDRPGAKFREPFGAVPVVLSLDYPATV
jgi:flagellum-specific peptidoglycan hydrolase FlgJ